jgi:hypothetical protein
MTGPAMTEPSASPDASTEVATAVRDLMPDIRRLATTTIALITAAVVISVGAAVLFLNSGMDAEGRWKAALFTLFFGALAVYHAFRWMIRRQEALVMPVLASAVGLSYSKDAKPFVKALPDRLLPARGIRTGEDHIHGKLGARAIQMAEVNVETGGKNSKTLFKGLVAQFRNSAAMPAFFIALEDKTRPGMFFGGEISTDGLHHLRNVHGGGGRTYGVWTSWSSMEEPPALSAVVDVFTRIENHVGYGAELYAATSNGEEMHVALSHKRNLFRVGGLFPKEDEIFADVQAAMQDLTVPLTLAKALIEAEEAALAKV